MYTLDPTQETVSLCFYHLYLFVHGNVNGLLFAGNSQYYGFFDSSYKTSGSTATLKVPLVGFTSCYCVEFAYHMYGMQYGSFKVTETKNGVATTLFQQTTRNPLLDYQNLPNFYFLLHVFSARKFMEIRPVLDIFKQP